MSDPAIKIENLGKKYLIRHEHRERYTALREVLANKAKGLGRRIIDLGRSPMPQTSSKEEFWALKDVSFEVQPGERIGIIGRNGAGKSTLLKLLSRITEPSVGRIELNGRVGSLLEVGTGFHPELTGRENIFLNGAILGMSKEEITRRFDEIVAFAEVEKFLDTPVKRYSSGMYVRLAFAVAAHLHTEVLLIDEVLAVGDFQFQEKCLGKMQDVGESGRTILFISHNMSAMQRLCSNAILLNRGRTIALGPTKEVVAEYTSQHRDLVYCKSWENDVSRPRNSSAALLGIAARATSGEIIDDLTTETAFLVCIDFEITEHNSRVGVSLILNDDKQQCVLSSINNRDVTWHGKVHPKGKYRSTCHVPGNLLNNGRYSISVIIYGSGYTDSLLVRDVLQLDVLDGIGLRNDFFGRIEGAIRPDLAWKTTPIMTEGVESKGRKA